ncbi:hypothetical protein DM45_3892 [Burkholderia mallei]|nr:hypothetical protein DM45_3892 [Burkholderia mallei]
MTVPRAAVHRAVPVVVGDGRARPVHRQLRPVHADAMKLRIRIREQAPLQQPVLGRLDARHEIRRRKRRLLGFLEHVAGIPVERHRADLHLGHAGPDFRRVERIERELVELIGLQRLDIEIPLRIPAGIDRRDQVARHVVEILALDRFGLRGSQVLLPLEALPVELHVGHAAMGVDELVRVHAVAVHLAVTRRRAGVRIDARDHVRRLRLVREEIEESVGVLNVRVRRRLQRMHHVRELHRVADEENRQIIADEIPVALRRVELRGETARVPQRFGRRAAVDHAGKAHENGRLRAGLEHLRPREIRDVAGRDEHAVRARAPRMHDALGNALTIETLQLLDQVAVLQQDRPVRARGLRILVVADGSAVVARERRRMRGERARRRHRNERAAQPAHGMTGNHVRHPHCFDRSPNLTKRLRSMNFYISIAPIDVLNAATQWPALARRTKPANSRAWPGMDARRSTFTPRPRRMRAPSASAARAGSAAASATGHGRPPVRRAHHMCLNSPAYARLTGSTSRWPRRWIRRRASRSRSIRSIAAYATITPRCTRAKRSGSSRCSSSLSGVRITCRSPAVTTSVYLSSA